MYVTASLYILFFSANNFLISSVIFVISNSPFHFYYVVAFYTFSRDFRCLGRDFRTAWLGISTFSRDFHCLGRDSQHHAPPRRISPRCTPTARPTTAHPTTVRPTTAHPTTAHPTTASPHHGTPHYGDTSRCCFSIHFIVIIIFYKGNN